MTTSSVLFKLSYDETIAMWRRVFTEAYQPEAIYRRFEFIVENVFPKRITPPNNEQRVNGRNIRKAFSILGNLLVRVGIFADYRDVFWKIAKKVLRKGDVQSLIHVGLVSHHLITFARQAGAGERNASFYSETVDTLKASVGEGDGVVVGTGVNAKSELTTALASVRKLTLRGAWAVLALASRQKMESASDRLRRVSGRPLTKQGRHQS